MIRVVDRIGKILTAFTLDEPQLTLTACARSAELTKSSTYRLLQSLEETGLVERNGSLWRLGPSVVSLATVRLGLADLRAEALEELRGLRTAFQAAVAFSIPEGADMIYLERFDSPDAFGVSARLGARAPMWAGASGKAILSRMPEDDRSRRLEVDEWRRLPHEVRGRVLAEINLSATRGYAIDTGEFFNGIGGVATAIQDTHQTPVAAVTVIVPTERLTDEFVPVVGAHLLSVKARLEAFTSHSPKPKLHTDKSDAELSSSTG
jgi:IclR family transcriptional regulator, pca regulon regulatory protein